MKYFIAIILFFAAYVFAQQDACEQMHSKMLMHLKQQNVILCRVSGIEKRTDVFGFFFKFDNIPTVLLYGDTYDAMMYMVEDLKNVKCLNNSKFRALTSEMTAEQIASKLMSIKNCDVSYTKNHPVTSAKWSVYK